MTCKFCNNTLPVGAKFCNRCGTKVNNQVDQKIYKNSKNSDGSQIIKKVFLFILIFGLGNIILWAGQELYYRNDTLRIETEKRVLNDNKVEIDQFEININSVESDLSAQDTKLESLKARGEIDSYNSGVADYNLKLTKFQADYSVYGAMIDEYNKKVDEVNTLIKKSGTRWYIIPLPSSRGSNLSKISNP